MTPTVTSIAASFAIFCIVFRILEILRPKQLRRRIRRAGFFTDVIYWAFTPFVTRAVTMAALAVVTFPIATAIYGRVDHDLIMHGHGPLSRLPLWAQVVGILLLGDLGGYWMHRAFHRGRLWNFHAVHHSSTELDWLSSVRVHPVNDAVMRGASTVPVLIAGFAPIALSGAVPVLTLMSILIHANVDWDFGPLRMVIASPKFHRWHHTEEHAARDKNFAGILPLWDLVFGTYYMPKTIAPRTFGTVTPVPHGFGGQLLFPFRRRGASSP